MKKKILLINPAYKSSIAEKSRVLSLPPYALLILATMVKDQYDVEIVDEAFEDIDFDAQVDIVGITCLTYTAPIAYNICEKFKERGIPTVIGGVHPTIFPEEASKYADSVVVGEGDEVWSTVLEDFENNNLQKIYYVEKRPDIYNLPPLRRDLLKAKYAINTIQTTRGCPNRCKYCAVTHLNGGTYRYRNLDKVIEEILLMKSKHFFITDDNLVGVGKKAESRAMDFFHRLKGLKKEWAAQACISIADQPELLEAAREGGARALLVGIESLNSNTLASYDKAVNIQQDNVDYIKNSIKKIHDQGIAVIGSFIFSPLYDTFESIDRTLDFIIENEIDAIQIFLLTPLPGSALYNEFEKENKLVLTDFPADWEAYNGFAIVHETGDMTAEQMYRKMFEVYKKLSTFRASVKRGWKAFRVTKSPMSTGLALFWNRGIYSTLKSVPQLKPYAV